MIQYTAGDLVRHVRAFFRSRRPDGVLTAHEDELISDSVAAAIMAVFSDYSLDDWRFNIKEIDTSFVSGQKYVDIESTDYEVLSVMSGTVRITSPESMLQFVPKDQIYASDPSYSSTGIPMFYSVERATYDGQNANNIRLFAWPIPDDNYNVSLSMTVAYNSGTETKIPAFLTNPLKTKAVEIAARWIGGMDVVESMHRMYKRDLQSYHINNNTDRPKVIPNHHGIL